LRHGIARAPVLAAPRPADIDQPPEVSIVTLGQPCHIAETHVSFAQLADQPLAEWRLCLGLRVHVGYLTPAGLERVKVRRARFLPRKRDERCRGTADNNSGIPGKRNHGMAVSTQSRVRFVVPVELAHGSVIRQRIRGLMATTEFSEE